MLWDEDKEETRIMRTKEESADYRYFPDPDLPPHHISDSWIEEVRSTLPELPWVREDRLRGMEGITDYDVADYQHETPVHAQPGDLLVHHSMCIHRADENPSSRPRRALGFVYFAARAKEDAEKAEAYRQQLYEEWERDGQI